MINKSNKVQEEGVYKRNQASQSQNSKTIDNEDSEKLPYEDSAYKSLNMTNSQSQYNTVSGHHHASQHNADRQMTYFIFRSLKLRK